MCTAKIDIKPLKLRHQKPVSIEYCYMELHDRYLRYCVDLEAEEPVDKEDLLRGWEKVHTKFDYIILKERVVGVDLAWNVFNGRWAVYILVDASEDFRAFFTHESDAIALRGKILEWLLT